MHCVSAGARRLFRCSCCCWLLLIAAAAALLLCDEAAAQGTSCGKLVKGQVDPVTVAAVRSSTSSSIRVDWLAPDRGITGYFYIVNCPSCPTQQHNTTDETYTFRSLNGVTEYNISIQAGLQNCRLSPAFHLSGKTRPNSILGPVHISDVTETSFRARWAASPDVGVEYEVSCAGRVPDATAVCTGQPSGASVTVRVRPVKTGLVPGSYIYGTALTKLFPIDASSVSFTITETTISLTWAASITEGVLYRVTYRRVSTGSSSSLPPSKYLSATFANVQSGEAYNLSVAVSKQGGFHEVVTWLPIQLTKLFSIDASSAQYSSNETTISVTWQPSSTSGVSYQLTCKRVGSGEVSTASSSTPSGTCGSLQSGQAYELRVAVQKTDGFGDVITALSNQLTKDSVAPAVSGVTILLIPGGPVRLSWKPLSPELGRGVVFEFELRLDGPGGCAAARRLNCSDCGRHRLQLQSEEARQRLEALTADCSVPVLVRTFEFGDASLSAEVAVSSEGASPSSLLPWTEYGASLWPVNLAGPGAVASASFRSPETRSGAVGGLRATPSEAEVQVEFEEPRLPNGLLQAFAVQVFKVASNVCSKLLVLNSTNAGCQLPSCTTGSLLNLLSGTCDSTQYVNNSGNGSDAYAVRVRQLQPGTEYSVRVTPVSQTLAGDSAELNFVTAGGDGGGGAATIVVAVVVPLVVILAIAAASLIFLRIRRQNRSPQKAAKPVSDSPAGSRVSGAPNDYATVVGGSAQSSEYVEIPAVNGRR